MIFVGGLSDGLLFADYVRPLALALAEHGWRTAHALLSSSLIGWGTGSVARDAAELRRLAAYLEREHGSCGAVILGHSTGCQDAVQCARDWGAETAEDGESADGSEGEGGESGAGAGASRPRSPLVPRLLGVILQAPVSDREAFLQEPGNRRSLEEAQAALARGEPDAFVRTITPGVPLSAWRANALLSRNGADDMFSVDFDDGELERALAALRGLPSLFVLGATDACYPPGTDVEKQGRRLQAHAGDRAEAIVLPGGHSQMGSEAELVRRVVDWLQRTYGDHTQ